MRGTTEKGARLYVRDTHVGTPGRVRGGQLRRAEKGSERLCTRSLRGWSKTKTAWVSPRFFFFFLRGSHLVGREHPVVEVAREGLIDVIADAQHGTETASEHMHRQRGAPA